MNGGKNITILPEPAIIKERITRKVLRPLMSQFSSLSEAILELVDNAFDEFDGFHGGNHLDIDIFITKNSITVENLGGKGMGKNELSDWLNWGDPHKKNVIGEFGQGGKAAMGYIGSSWIVQTKKWDEPWLWEIKENNWDDASSETKIFTATPTVDDIKNHNGLGYCKFEIRKLKKHLQNKKRIREVLANIYRIYLEKGTTTIKLNHEPIHHLILPLYEGFKNQTFKEKTKLGFTISGWIGRLKRDARVKGEQRVTGGVRLLRNGRLIKDGEYFGHPNFLYKASLGNLVGEVELSKVPVLPNKTDFDTDSAEWESVQELMYKILKPHIDDLLNQKEEDNITREEKKRVSQIRDAMIDAFKLLNKYTELSDKLEKDKGRKPPESSIEEKLSITTREESESRREKPEPRTPPPENAIGKLKRLAKMPDWELRDLESNIRSAWEIKEGRRTLLINRKYCLYNEWQGDDLYVAETASLELSKPEGDEKLSLDQYLGQVNLLMQAFCEVYTPNN